MNKQIKLTVEEMLKDPYIAKKGYTFESLFDKVCKKIEDTNGQFHSYHIDWNEAFPQVVFNVSNLSECLHKIKTDLFMEEAMKEAYAEDVIKLDAETFEEQMKERLDEYLDSKGISDRYSDDIFLDFCDFLYDKLTRNFDRGTGETLSVIYTDEQLNTITNDFFARIPQIEQDDKRTLFKFNIPTYLSDMDAFFHIDVYDPVDKEKEHPRMWAQRLVDSDGISVGGFLLANDIKNTAYEKTLFFIRSFPSLCRDLQDYSKEMQKTIEELNKKLAKNKEFSLKGVYIEPCIEDGHLDYILVHDRDLTGSESVYEVAENLIYLDQIRSRSENERERFEKYYCEHLITSEYMKTSDMDDNLSAKWDGFSDYHKDLYGYRPHSDDRNVPLQKFLSNNGNLGKKYIAYVKSQNALGKEAMGWENYKTKNRGMEK